jgi:hypothetical protein
MRGGPDSSAGGAIMKEEAWETLVTRHGLPDDGYGLGMSNVREVRTAGAGIEG